MGSLTHGSSAEGTAFRFVNCAGHPPDCFCYLNNCNEIPSTTESAGNLKGNIFVSVLVNTSANITSSFTRRKSAQDRGGRMYLGRHFPAFPKSQAAEVGSEGHAYRRRKPQHWGAVVQYKQPANQIGY